MWLFGSWLAWQKTLLTYKNTFVSLANNFYLQQNWFPCSSIFWTTWHQQPEGTSAVKSGSSCPSPFGQLIGSVQYQFATRNISDSSPIGSESMTAELLTLAGKSDPVLSVHGPPKTQLRRGPAFPGWMLRPNWLLCFCSCILGSRWGAGCTLRSGDWLEE